MKKFLKILPVIIGALLLIVSIVVQMYISLSFYNEILFWKFIFIEHWSRYTFISGVILFGTGLCFNYK